MTGLVSSLIREGMLTTGGRSFFTADIHARGRVPRDMKIVTGLQPLMLKRSLSWASASLQPRLSQAGLSDLEFSSQISGGADGTRNRPCF